MSSPERIREMSLDSLVGSIKVTSVLHDDTKTYGKQFLFDGREDTCWNSDAGLPQSILLSFMKPITLDKIQIMFQGGFVGTECDIILSDGLIQNSDKVIHTIFPEDINELQTFILPNQLDIGSTENLELKFKHSSDFYGRITVYIVHFEGRTH